MDNITSHSKESTETDYVPLLHSADRSKESKLKFETRNENDFFIDDYDSELSLSIDTTNSNVENDLNVIINVELYNRDSSCADQTYEVVKSLSVINSCFSSYVEDENDTESKRLDYVVVENVGDYWPSKSKNHRKWLQHIKFDVPLGKYLDSIKNDSTRSKDSITSKPQDYCEVDNCDDEDQSDLTKDQPIVSHTQQNQSSQYELSFQDSDERSVRHVRSSSDYHEFNKNEFWFNVYDIYRSNSDGDNSILNQNYTGLNSVIRSDDTRRSENVNELLYKYSGNCISSFCIQRNERGHESQFNSDHTLSTSSHCDRLDYVYYGQCCHPKSCTTFSYNENSLLLEISELNLQNKAFMKRIESIQSQLDYSKDSYYLNKKYNNELNNNHRFKQNNRSHNVSILDLLSGDSTCYDNSSDLNISNIGNLNQIENDEFFNNRKVLLPSPYCVNRTVGPDQSTKRKTVEVLFPVKSYRNTSLKYINTEVNDKDYQDHVSGGINDQEKECVINCFENGYKFVNEESRYKIPEFVNTCNFVNINNTQTNNCSEVNITNTLENNINFKDEVVNILEDFLKENIVVSNMKGVNYDVFIIPKSDDIHSSYSNILDELDNQMVEQLNDTSIGARRYNYDSYNDELHKGRNRKRRNKNKKKKKSSKKIKQYGSEILYNGKKQVHHTYKVTNRFYSLPKFNLAGVKDTKNEYFHCTAVNSDVITVNSKKIYSLYRCTDFLNKPTTPDPSFSFGDSHRNNLFKTHNSFTNKTIRLIKAPKPRKHLCSEILNELNNFKKVFNEIECRQNSLLRMLCYDPCGFLYQFPTDSKIFC